MLRADFLANGVAHATLEIEVPTCAARHGHGKASGVMHDDAASAIGKSQGRNLQAGVTAGQNWRIIVFQAFNSDELGQFPPVRIAGHLVDFFGEGHFSKKFVSVLVKLQRSERAAARDVGHFENVRCSRADKNIVGGKFRMAKPSDKQESDEGKREEGRNPFQDPIDDTLEFHWHLGRF